MPEPKQIHLREMRDGETPQVVMGSLQPACPGAKPYPCAECGQDAYLSKTGQILMERAKPPKVACAPCGLRAIRSYPGALTIGIPSAPDRLRDIGGFN